MHLDLHGHSDYATEQLSPLLVMSRQHFCMSGLTACALSNEEITPLVTYLCKGEISPAWLVVTRSYNPYWPMSLGETKKESKSMTQNSNRKGLALSAAFALIVSMFATVPAASAATDGSDIGAYPVAGTTFEGALVSDFPVFTQLKPSSITGLFTGTNLVYKVEKTAGTNMDVMISASASVVSMLSATSTSHAAAANGSASNGYIQAGSTSDTVSAVISSGIANLNFKAHSTSAVASWSPVTLKITAWLDTQGSAKNDAVDSDELFTTFTVTLGTPSATVTLTQPNEGDTKVTVSAAISGVNLKNVQGNFYLAMSSSSVLYTAGAASVLADSPQSGSAVALKGGVVSNSFTVNSISKSQSVSAALRYVATGTNGMYDGIRLGSVATAAATGATIDALVTTVAKSDHATASGQTVAVRPNQTYTVKVHAGTGSPKVSVSGVAISVALSSNTTLAENSKLISVNGGAATSSFPTALALTTGTDGYATFTVATTGFEAGNTLVVNAKSGNTAASALTMTATAPAYSIVNDYSIYATTPGVATKIGYSVEDQWGVALAATNYRIQVTRGGTGFAYATTVSEVAVAAGAATFEFTPSPATKTGSAVVSAVLQKFDASLNSWISGGSADADVTVTVTDVAAAFSVAPAVSVAASVSYFPSTVSWKTVTGTSKNIGSDIQISGDSTLVFRAASGKATASGALTVRTDATGAYTFDVASLRSGKFTISQKVGTTTSTTLLVVDAAAADSGKSISFDKTALVAGETAKITGTVVDANGNAVYTTGSADVVVSWAGLGLPFNTGTVETDADGKFSINVLVLATEVGTGTITATYRPAGDAASTKNVTVASVLAIGTPAAEVAAVIGSFNGRWAVRVENAKGSAVVIKVGGNWYKTTATSDSFVFSRKSRVGATPLVKVWVDGALQNEQTVTVK